MKLCTGCGQEKPNTEEYFYKRSDRDVLKSKCKECCKKTAADWRSRVIDKKLMYRQGRLRRIGWDLDREAAYREKQTTCAICGDAGHLDCDHDHKTGKPRALLCRACNAGLGKMKDDVDVLKSAIRYIEKWKEINNE